MGANTNNGYLNNLFSRSFGGTQEPRVSDPYISGYGYLYFDNIPSSLTSMTESFSNITDISKALTALSYVITPPTIALEKLNIQGVGGTQWNAPTRLNINGDYTIEFIELSQTPITKILDGWVTMIRDYRTGVSALNGNNSNAGSSNNLAAAYSKSSYAGTMYYWTTKPDGITIETAWYYTGVFPLTFVSSEFVTDVATNGELKITATMSFDNIYKYSQQQIAGNTSLATTLYSYSQTIMAYRNKIQAWGPTSSL